MFFLLQIHDDSEVQFDDLTGNKQLGVPTQTTHLVIIGIEIIHSGVHDYFQPHVSEGFCSGKKTEAMRRFIGLSLTLLTTFAKEQDGLH